MRVELHPLFEKSYRKRIVRNPNLAARTAERIRMFIENPRDPTLQDHALVGKKSHLRAFSVTGDVRIVYYPVTDDHVVYLDIGMHPQVY